MRLLLDSGGEGGGGDGKTHVETIRLDVVSPKQDFASQGGIHDAMVALRQLDEYYTGLQGKFKSGFQFGGAGGGVSPSGEIKLTIAGSAIHAALAPGEKIRLNLTGADFQVISGPTSGGFGGGAGGSGSSPIGGASFPASGGSPGLLQREWDMLKNRRLSETFTAGQFGQSRERLFWMGDKLLGRTLYDRPVAEGTEAIRQAYNEERRRAMQERTGVTAGMAPGMPKSVRDRMEREADAAYHARLANASADIASHTAGVPGYEKVSDKFSDITVQHQAKYVEATNAATLANDHFNESTRLIGKNMLQNIKHVTTWAASVGVLYGSIRLLTRSLEENMEIGKQQAILSQIFKGNADAVRSLTNDVIELASRNGQSASEAMKSATEFARIYRTQAEIVQATNAALVQANITGEEAGKTTEFLSAMTQVYHLHSSELMGVVGQMAAISQNYNVTNINLAKGLETVAESAKVAGMNIGELLGLISGGIAGTQQSGTTIGNTVKTMITQMANPEIQQKLRFQGVDVTEQGFGLKQMPEIFRNIVSAYERMNDAEKRSLLFNVGGRQNATRMAAILDNYIKGQMEAINGQLNMNAAEQENSKIMETLKGQTAAVVAEWDRFVKIQGDAGPMQVLTTLTEGFRNLLRLVNTPTGSVLTTLLGALGIGVGARTLLTGYRATSAAQEGQKSSSIFVSTGRAVRNATSDLELWYSATVSGQRAAMGFGGALVQASYGMTALGTASRLTLASMAALRASLPLIGAFIALAGINKLVRAYSGDSELEALQKAQTQAGGRADAYRSQGSLYSTVSGILSDPNVKDSEKLRVLQQISGSSGEARTAATMLMSGRGADVAAYYGMRGTGSEALARQADTERLMLLRREMDMRSGPAHGNFYMAAGQTISDLTFGSLGRDMAQKDLENDSRLVEIQQQMREIQSRQSEAAREHGPGFLAQQILERSAASFPQAIAGGISSQFGMLSTGDSATSALHRNIAEYESQARFWQNRNDQIQREISGGVTGPRLQLLEKARAAAESGIIESGSRLADESDPFREIQVRQQDRLRGYQRFGQAEFAGMGIGMTPGEQMAEQQRRGERRLEEIGVMGAMAGGLGRSSAAEALQIEIGLMQNKASAQEKIIELVREEINLNITARREYERSLLTSSPSELLRKMAVAGITHGRTMSGPNAITGGEFFSMSQEAREDFLRMPGNTEAERLARRGRSALEHQFFPHGMPGAFGAGEISANANLPTSRYRGLVPDITPNIGLTGEHIATVVAFSDELQAATRAVVDFRNSLTGSPTVAHAPKTHSAPPVAQAPLSLPAFMAFGMAH